MTDEETEKGDWIDRRTLLKGTATAGLAGIGLSGVASAGGYNQISFCSADDEEFFGYEVCVTGEVKRGGTYETDADDEIFNGGKCGTGGAGEGRCDSWLFKGEPTRLELSGRGKVFVNGKLFKDTTGEEDQKEDDKEKHELTFCSAENDLFTYQARVSGTLSRGGTYQSDEDDVIGGDGHTVDGAVSAGRCDSFHFTGDLEKVEMDGRGKILVDGEVVQNTMDGEKELPRLAVISTPGDEPRFYSFRVTGNVKLLDEVDGPPVDDEIIDEGDTKRVEGGVSTGDDQWAFSGEFRPINTGNVNVEIRER